MHHTCKFGEDRTSCNLDTGPIPRAKKASLENEKRKSQTKVLTFIIRFDN